MNGFSFDITADAGKNRTLVGNQIHDVTFDGCEAQVIDVKDKGKMKVLDIKFSNGDGSYRHRVFEPTKEEDFKDRDMGWGVVPSNVTTMMLLFKHLIDAVNPNLGKEITDKKKSLNTTSWDSLCKLVMDSTNPFIGTKTKIKLVKNKDGFAAFPYFATLRNGVPDYKTKFIGNDIKWSSWELDKIAKEEAAKPVSADEFAEATMTPEAPTKQIDDFTF